MKYFSLDEANLLKIVVTNTNVVNIVTTKVNLLLPFNPDIGWIPEPAPEYGQAAKLLSGVAIEDITSPTHLSPLQQEFFSVNYKLNHITFTIMPWLAKMSILPCRFLKLSNDLPPCVSCLFGKAPIWPWRHKSLAKPSGGVLCSSDI